MKIGTYKHIVETPYITTKTFSVSTSYRVALNYKQGTFIYKRLYGAENKFSFCQSSVLKGDFLTPNSNEYKKIKTICVKLFNFYTKSKLEELKIKFNKARDKKIEKYITNNK